MDFTANHINWLKVGEMIRLLQAQLAPYVDEIVTSFHEHLCQYFENISTCKSKFCTNRSNGKLCLSCQTWWKNKLKKFHKKKDCPNWLSKNCHLEMFFVSRWEIAKFFMTNLGSNAVNVTDAQSTDLSSLLNFIEWTNDDVYSIAGKQRVMIDSVLNVRSIVRNSWAHASVQELIEEEKDRYFVIGRDFLIELKIVFPRDHIGMAIEKVDHLQANGIPNLIKSEIEILHQQRDILQEIKESLDPHSNELKRCVDAMKSCQKRLEETPDMGKELNTQFEALSYKIESLLSVVRDNSKDSSTALSEIKNCATKDREQKQRLVNCLPERNPNFIPRGGEMEKVFSFLNDECVVLCIHGGPGFGKSTLAVEVAYRLSSVNDAFVVFSDTKHLTNVNAVIFQLCCDLDLNLNQEDDLKKQFLTQVLRNDGRKVFLIIDDVDGILENEQSKWNDFIKELRKNTIKKCHFITTSRMKYAIPDIKTGEVAINQMDKNLSLNLLKKLCPAHDVVFLRKLASCCGYNPLAMCIAALRVDDFPNHNELLKYLTENSNDTLQDSMRNLSFNKSIQLSYDRLNEEEQRLFTRLSVFEGTFSIDAANSIFEKENLETINILKKIHMKNLISKSCERQYSLHTLIRHFLNKKGDQSERQKACKLMVEYNERLHLEIVRNLKKKTRALSADTDVCLQN